MSGYWYLASPYTKYPHGLDAACEVACQAAGLLIRGGVNVFAPIPMSHAIAMASGIDPLDHKIWLPLDLPFMQTAIGLIMLRAESWESSYGMKVELETFRAAGKPVRWMEPGLMPELYTIYD